MTDDKKEMSKSLPRELPNVQAAILKLLEAFAVDGLEIAGVVVCGVPAGAVGSIVVTCLKNVVRAEQDGQPVPVLSGLLEQAVRGIHEHAKGLAGKTAS
jgi:hypothetical protein